jgi:DNA-binding response OmpR family regulator
MAGSRLLKRKRTIMVVDDNRDLVEIIRVTLESNGFNVMCFYSGEELLAALEKEKPDLILLDVMMPQMNGFEVLTKLKWKAATGSIPVILLTAKVHHDDVLRGYKLGTDNYIKKPFDNTQLVTSINRLLGLPDIQPSRLRVSS